MAVELPEPLQWVLLLLAGTRWPEADEDMLRDMAERWRDGAKTLEDAGRSADSAVKRALDGQRGSAADALAKHWSQFTTGKGTEEDPGYFPGLVQACNGMGDMLEAMANSAETAKIQIVAQLGILAFEIATAEAEAPFTAGVSLAEIPVFVGISRTAVQQILKQLLKETLEFAAKQAAQMAAINLMAQGIEVMEGHRKSIDMKELGQNALGGAVAGASGHLIGKGLSAGGSKLGLSSVMETTAGRMAHGAAVGVGADVSTQLITTGHVEGGSLLGSGLSGGASVGLHRGASAVKGHFNGPPKIPTPHAGPEGAGGGTAGAGGTPVFSKSDSGSAGYRGPSGDGPSGGAPHEAPASTGSTGSAASAGSAGGSVGGHSATGLAGGPNGSTSTGSSAGAGSSAGTVHGGGEGGASRPESAPAPSSGTRGLVPFGSDRPAPAAEHTPAAETPVHTSERPATEHPATEHLASERPAPAETAATGQPTPHAADRPAPAAEHTPAPETAAAPAATRGDSAEPAPRPAEPVHQVAESAPHAPETTPRGTEQAPAAHEQAPGQVHQQAQPQAHQDVQPSPHTSTGERPATADHAGDRVPSADRPTTVPVHEAPAPTRDTSVPAHETPTPVPTRDTAVPVHETPVHETPVRETPVHETPVRETSAQVPPAHEAPVHAQQPTGPVHDTTTPVHETPAPAQQAPSHAQPGTGAVHPTAPPVHEAPAPVHEGAAERPAAAVPHAAAPAPAPAQSHVAGGGGEHRAPAPESDAPAPASSRLDGTGPLGGAPHLAASGGDTHLNGGTRVSGGQTQSRPAPETVPGNVVPDNAASTVQQPAGTPPVAGGFVPGPVPGGGAAHTAGGGARTPSTHGPTGPVSQRPVEPTPQPAGGTVRPGAGRTSDTHVPPPPPPSHRAGGTPRTLGDPNGSSSSAPRTGRTGDEHLPPPPPPPSGNSGIRPIDEAPTPEELAQLHQHPAGPSLIHPPKADPAALARYKSDNKFNFRLTGELQTAANALPHSSWGRHDSGVQTPNGRPDVKVSPYSQSFKSHLDPLTLKALHPVAANAVTPHLRNELGPEAMAFQGNQVLEAAGNLDFRTQEHFQQQEIRRNVLERLARQDSQQDWHPVGEQRVNDHLDGSVSAMDGVNRLLGGHNGHPGFDGIVLGEAHNQSPSWRFLNENMHGLKAAGVERIYVESLRDDAFQQHLDAYQRSDGTMSPNLEKMLRTYDRSQNSPAGAGLYDTVVRAKIEGVTVHAVDGYPARRPHDLGRQALEERARLLNSYMNHAITDAGGTGKYVLVTGKAHVHEHPTGSEHRIPGVAEMLGAPSVRLTDGGRPNPDGAPHDATVATAAGDMRLGYLPRESTGQDPANAAQQHGNGAPPAPPAPPVPHQGGDGSSQSTHGLGTDSTPAPPAPPVSHQGGGSSSPSPRSLGGDNTPPPPAPPTRQHTAGSAQSGHQNPPTTTPNTTPAPGHNAPATGGHNAPSTTGHTNPPAAGQHNAPSTSAHDQFLDRQKQARDAELQALSGKSPVRDAVDQLGREQRPVATPPVGADRLRQDLPTMSPQERTRELAGLTPENRRWLARDPQTVDALKNGLPPKEFAKTAAELMVHVDPRAERAPSARQEAQQQIARMLQDPETAARLLKNGADVVVVPKDVRMPDVPELNDLRGVHNNSSAGAGRGYDDMRGSGGRHSAITEENLLGEHTPIGHGGHYEDGYSTTTHEFTHTVHRYGLDAHDQKLITDTFNQKQGDPNAAWPDGPRHDASGKPVDNYSSRDEQEYFAQVTNAYLGNNHGTDPYTGQPRNNGADWVRQNEPAMLPLLEKLYGKDPGAVHSGPANPVHATTAENQMYEGFRDFMDRVDGNGSNPPGHQPPATPPPVPSAGNPGQHGGSSSHLPPPPPKAPGFGSKPAADDGYSHKIDGEKAFDAIKDFLPDSAEFDKVKDSLKKYERSALIDGDTDAILHAYQQQKQLHVDVLRRNVPEQLDAVNHRLDEIARQGPDRQAELAGEKHNLETAKAHLEDQRDRLAVYEHELARLKGEPKSGTAEFKALQDARAQAEPWIAKDAMARIEEQRKAVGDLRQEAVQRRDDAETAYQNENNKRTATGSTKETAAEAAAKTTRNVFASRVEDLGVREEELAKDLQARKDALAGNYGATPPKPKKGAEHELTDGAYRAAFGYSDHGVMAGEPHAEKTVRRMEDGKVKLGTAVVNRNHVVADYMVHKYVTAAVFKARSFGDEQHRVEASRTFSDFADTMAPDQHRVLDKAGKQAVKRLGANGQEHAALAWRDLGYTAKDVDLGKAYGNDRLEPAFAPAKLDDPASAVAARDEVRDQLDRSGLEGPAKAEFDRYADTVERFSGDPSPQHLAEMKDALADVRTKVREQAVEDLALVHGVTGPRRLDDTVAAARQAAAEPPAGPGNSPAHERLADRLDDLARSYDRLGQDRQDLKGLADELRNDPNAVRPERLEAFADKLPNERDRLRQDEVDRRREEAAQTLKPGGTAADQQKAAQKLLPKADADIAAVARQYGGGLPRAGAGEKHPAGLFDQAVQAKVEDVPKLIEEITAGLSNSASNLRFGDELTNKWIQNFLDPHVVRDQDVLTAVAKGDLPPEALYSPHTLDLLRGLRTLEDTGLAPGELRDLMAPKTEADMVDLHQPGQKPSASAVNIADEHGMLNHAGGKTPVSSSGDFTRQPGQSANPVVGSEALHDPARDARPGAEGHEIGTTPPPATPRPPAGQDTDVVMASADHGTPTGTQDHDTPMPSQSQDHPVAPQQTARPEKRRVDPDDDVLMADAPPSKRSATDAVPTPPPPPPVAHPAAGDHRSTGTRGFGTLPSPPPPPPTQSHTPATGTPHQPTAGHGGAPEHQGQQHEGPQHDGQHHEADPLQHHEDADQQPHDDQQLPPVEPLLPPVGTPEHGIMHDPGSFLRDTPLGVDFGSGLRLRTEGLQQHQVNSFLARFEGSDRHWFALVRDPARSTPDRDAFVLTPAWEKYAQHSEEFRPPAGVHLPDPMPDHHYVTALYAPYKSGTAGGDHTIGHVQVPLHPDPARPGDGLVFTGGMNGCAFVATDVNPHTDTFQLWHFQSYSAKNNLIGGADFRAGKTVTDWFGPDEYRSPHPFTFEVTNVLHHGPDGWHVTSQESVQEHGNPHVGRQTTRPFRLDPPGEADRVQMTVGPYHINAREQVERFDDLANKLQGKLPPATDPKFRTVRNELLGQLGDLRGRLVAQADAVGALAQPGTTMQQVHDSATALRQQAAADRQHAQGESMLFTARMSALGHANPRFHELEALQRQLFDEFPPQDDRSWLSVMSRDSAGQLQRLAEEQQQHDPAQGFGSLPSAPPPVTTHGTGASEHQQSRAMDVDEPAPAVPHRQDADGDTVMQDRPESNSRKRGRDEDDHAVVEREDKRRRTPSYENTDAVMHDRGYQAVGARHPLTQDLVSYLGGEPKVHPPMSSSLLGKVNPHAAPVHPGEGFRPGNDLNACLENVEAYRDTHFGRPRVSGQTLHGNVEPIPGNTLWKRHDGPALFGEGDAAVRKLMETVQAGGPGSFATVLGAGKEGAGHAVALVHDRDGRLRWADLTDRKVTPATGGMPENFRSDWTVWASVADPHETNISGPHDPNFMDTYSTFTRPRTEHAPEPMDVDDFGTVPPSDSPMDVDSTPAPPQRRTLAVAVQTAVVGPDPVTPHGRDIYLSEVLPSNDRPMTRFGTDQRSHTVPWALTRRAASGLAGRSAESVWAELTNDITEFKNYPPEPKGAAEKDYPAVKARWDDIVARLDRLPTDPSRQQSVEQWHRELGDLVSGYIELSQITSFASFADGRAVGHGEAGMLDRLGAFQRGTGPAPSTDEVVGTLLDIKQTASLSADDVRTAKEHLIRSLHRAYPDYMTPANRADIENQLGLQPVTVQPPGQLPPGTAAFTRYPLKSELVADLGAHATDPSRTGRIVLSEQSRPDTQFGSNQYSHAASWSLMRESLLSFEGRPRQDLETWLGDRFTEMQGHLDGPMSRAVDHAHQELRTLHGYPPHEQRSRVGDLVRIFVSAHQSLPHTTFVDQLQLGSATSSGELDFGLRGGPRHDELVASHFDGAAPFNSGDDKLLRSYRSWQTMAETLGPVRPETVDLVAGRTFTDKNMAALLHSGASRPLDHRIGQRYLEGVLAWDRAVTTAFPDDGDGAVTSNWQAHRNEFTVERFGRPTDPAVRRQVEDWFDRLTTSGRPGDAESAIHGLTEYYRARAEGGRRGTERAALASAMGLVSPPARVAGGKRAGDDIGDDLATRFRRMDPGDDS
ncbi:toxin glutamine deamidase domain-containing protein [Streptomyces sp. NRRL B-24484]|uniref:WXG100-like domain-containing protein n=1 Tax=Streptomyces sp. NRRL B-24484 TaxID=1463833 RepID=UPI0005BACE0F|nr:toxin glutamine deamidase domain-containing protein [Streptomyces sp. NRRL B-24484]